MVRKQRSRKRIIISMSPKNFSFLSNDTINGFMCSTHSLYMDAVCDSLRRTSTKTVPQHKTRKKMSVCVLSIPNGAFSLNIRNSLTIIEWILEALCWYIHSYIYIYMGVCVYIYIIKYILTVNSYKFTVSAMCRLRQMEQMTAKIVHIYSDYIWFLLLSI